MEQPPPLLPDWPRAFGPPPVAGLLRCSPEDFKVDEQLAFEPEGRGDHLWLHVRKRGANTHFIARRLAELAGLPPERVGYAGLKDRHAVTTQWFSLPLAGGAEPAWAEWRDPEMELLEAVRHPTALRRGELAGNRFRIVVRQLTGDPAYVAARVEAMRRLGVPNYFGEQRFGRDGGNLRQALALFSGEAPVRDRHTRGLYLSAARSYLFNRVLALRVGEGCWARAIPGDHLTLTGGDRHFIGRADDPAVIARIDAGQLHPTGPLWGEGPPPLRAEALALERRALAGCEGWQAGLARARLRQERRALRVIPEGLTVALEEGRLTVEFSLPPGCFATAVLRELVDYRLPQGAEGMAEEAAE